jgi:hypothetical protein
MTAYYFDIETNALKLPNNEREIDYANSPIITIQYQPIYDNTGKPRGDLTILKAWESSEEQILKQFWNFSHLCDYNDETLWNFIPVGCNLTFEFITLLHRWKHYNFNGVNATKLFKHSKFDIQSILTAFNRGKFKGSALNDFSKKKCNGSIIKQLVETKNYQAIIDYIEDEANAFIDTYKFIMEQLPKIGDERKIMIKEDSNAK